MSQTFTDMGAAHATVFAVVGSRFSGRVDDAKLLLRRHIEEQAAQGVTVEDAWGGLFSAAIIELADAYAEQGQQLGIPAQTVLQGRAMRRAVEQS